MGHGITELSDLTGLLLVATGIQQIFWPEFSHKSFGPFNIGGKAVTVKPFFETSKGTGLPNEALSIAGSLMIVIGFILFTVRWDKINGKLPGIGFFAAAFNFAQIGIQLDKGQIHLRLIHIVAGVLAIAGLRLFFHTKSDEADFMYLKEAGKKEALASASKTSAKDKTM